MKNNGNFYSFFRPKLSFETLASGLYLVRPARVYVNLVIIRRNWFHKRWAGIFYFVRYDIVWSLGPYERAWNIFWASVVYERILCRIQQQISKVYVTCLKWVTLCRCDVRWCPTTDQRTTSNWTAASTGRSILWHRQHIATFDVIRYRQWSAASAASFTGSVACACSL